MRFSKKLKILLFALLLFLSGANFIFAFEPELNYPRIPGLLAPQDFMDTPEAASLRTSYYLGLMIIASGIIVLLVMIIGAFRYLTSTGRPDKMASAKDQISSAFLGLLILLSSYLLLYVINPQFTTLDIPEPGPVEELEYPETEEFPIQEYKSFIHAELPLGKVIEENILETKETQNKERQRAKEKPRMDRIKDIGENSVKLADKIKRQTEDLKNLSKRCSCSQSQPCCENPNPGPGCKDNTCTTKPGCTCDPCKNQRSEIQRLEKENLKAMYEGIEIQQGKKTSLRQEQKKADNEIRLIKEELGKLETIEKLIMRCPPKSIMSAYDTAFIEGQYSQKDWFFERISIWDKIKVHNDPAVLYCPASGTAWESKVSPSTDFSELEKIIPLETGLTNEPLPCTLEIPIGEIMDRTKKVGYKLVERLEKLIGLNEQLIKATDELHSLISQCSSAGPSSDPQRSGCYSICQETLFSCIKYCQGDPCPDSAIEKKIKEIKDIIEGVPNKPAENEEKKEKEGIKDVVEAKKKEKEESIKDKGKREQIGIKEIIDKTVPELLKEIQITIRNTLGKCSPVFMANSQISYCGYLQKSAVSPEGELIENCCYEEEWFNDCLSRCYLEAGAEKNSSGNNDNDEKKIKQGETKYKKCLKTCLEEKAKEHNIEDIAKCRHLINFFCCTHYKR